MGYHIIDMAHDPRCGQFAYFRQIDFPFAGITVEMDITDFMACKGPRPFFLSFLYSVTREPSFSYPACRGCTTPNCSIRLWMPMTATHASAGASTLR